MEKLEMERLGRESESETSADLGQGLGRDQNRGNGYDRVDQQVLDLIPQRPPFLFVDRIIRWELEEGQSMVRAGGEFQTRQRLPFRVHTEKTLSGQEDFFKGHFPTSPIVPGVLLQEALFQSGAILMGLRLKPPSMPDDRLETTTTTMAMATGIGVVTKVEQARFKSLVRPGETLNMQVEIVGEVGHACYMKGAIRVEGAVVARVQFTCAMIEGV